MSRLIDADELETHEQIEPMGNGRYEYVQIVYKDDIDAAPTIEERKKGRWINHRSDEGHNIADCSECGATIQWFDGDDMPNFCCMCGSDMREVENDQG